MGGGGRSISEIQSNWAMASRDRTGNLLMKLHFVPNSIVRLTRSLKQKR